MVKPLLLICLLSIGARCLGQQVVEWDTLGSVSLIFEQNLRTNTWTYIPTYSPTLLGLAGESIQLTGYLIPDDVTGTQYYLSAYPLRACFFCGAAGPETVVRLELQDPKINFKVDQYVTFIGILRLAKASDGIIFTLASAKPH